jgi:cytoskeletal protein RodZ
MDPLNQQVPPVAPTTPPVSPIMTPAPEHKKIGPIVAVLVIVIVLVIGAIYLFASNMNRATPTNYIDSGITQQQDTSTNTSDSVTPAPAEPRSVAPVTNTSNDTASLEADLDASTNGLDSQDF